MAAIVTDSAAPDTTVAILQQQLARYQATPVQAMVSDFTSSASARVTSGVNLLIQLMKMHPVLSLAFSCLFGIYSPLVINQSGQKILTLNSLNGVLAEIV